MGTPLPPALWLLPVARDDEEEEEDEDMETSGGSGGLAGHTCGERERIKLE